MSQEKDIRFTEKKIDESWKERVVRDKGTVNTPSTVQSSGPAQQASAGTPVSSNRDKRSPETTAVKSSPHFINLISSLGYQALMNLGEVPMPDTRERILNLDAAREFIDLLSTLKVKTQGNLSTEEDEALTGLIAELQLKYSQKT